MSRLPITVLDHADFEVSVTPGIIEDEQIVKRNGQEFVGIPGTDLATAAFAAALRVFDFAITPVPDAAKSWDTVELNLAITHADALCQVTLPDATQVTNWVPATAPRRVFTMNASAFGWALIAPAAGTRQHHGAIAHGTRAVGLRLSRDGHGLLGLGRSVMSTSSNR
jgi:hypothetical protein